MFQKIVQNVCEIYYGKRKKLYLGNIKSKIDWVMPKNMLSILENNAKKKTTFI